MKDDSNSVRDQEKIRFTCTACGVKIKLPKGAEGHRAKCRNCGSIFTVPQAPPSAGMARVASPSADEELVALDQLAANLDTPADTADPNRDAVPCPACGSTMAQEAVVCVSCGYNRETRRRTTGVNLASGEATNERDAAAQSPEWAKQLVRGCLGAFIGGGLGAVAWIVVAVSTGYELGLIAWGLGMFTGVGMFLGIRDPSTIGGFLAAAIAAVCVLAARIIIVQIVFKPDLDLASLIIALIRGSDPYDVLFLLMAMGTAYWLGTRGPQSED